MRRALALPFLLAVLAAASSSEGVLPPPVNAQIGFAVSVDGNWLAVGAPRDDEAGEDAGAVFLYEWDGFCWRLQDKITAGNAQAEALFGSSLSLRGDLLAVGAPGADTVYVFFQNEGVWGEQVRKTVTDESGLRRFGHSVAITSVWLAVGEVDPHGREAGVVHVFQAPLWSEAPPVLALAEPQERARFGHALSLRGGTLAVGIPGSGQGAGAVHVFREQGGVWARQAVLTAGDGGAGDQLGHSVAVNDEQDLIVAGAPTAGAGNEGAAYVFAFEDNAWQQVSKLSGVAGEQSGLAVAIAGDRILVGAPFSSAGAPLSGAIRVFEREDGPWAQEEVLSDPVNGRPYDLHGFSVTASGGRAAAGAPLADRGANASGSTYSFNCIDVPTIASGQKARSLSVSRGEDR
ncbi:MAG TPA: FG-GAP repeat protein [Thermoanaerobaculia bacterium]